MKKQIFVFNGIHGSGKTVLAQLLAQNDQRFAYFSEIGRQVREEVDYNSLESGEEFDLEVMRRELERDRLLISEPKIPLIETWHIGNIGYVAVRSPKILDQYTRVLIAQLELFDPTCFYIQIDWRTFRSRITEKIKPHQIPQLIDFYKTISEKTHEIYGALGIKCLTIENQGAPLEGVASLREGIDFVLKPRLSKERPKI